MWKLFEDDGSYEFPNGSKMTVLEMRESHNYDILFNKTCIVEIVDGVFTSYRTLADFAKGYGVEYSTEDENDPQEIFNKVLEIKKLREENPPVTISDTVKRAAQIVALSFTDEQALEVPDLYPDYVVDHAYKQNDRFVYNGRLFKVNQDHTSAAQWVPGETGTESLYTCLEMAGDGYLVWTQPTGAHNAYNTGDIVHYPTADDPLYKSTIDGNVWAPDAYPQGWEVYTEE